MIEVHDPALYVLGTYQVTLKPGVFWNVYKDDGCDKLPFRVMQEEPRK